MASEKESRVLETVIIKVDSDDKSLGGDAGKQANASTYT